MTVPTAVIIDAPAKVNLRLLVLAREETGYHALETIFCGIGLADRLEVELAGPGIRLEVEGAIDTGPIERNLVSRAAEAFYAATGLSPRVSIRLVKRIPAAAGLGGGSSDAAATLRALDLLHGRACGEEQLLELGAALGSDVPFFLTPTPLALAWGRGHRLLSLPPLPSRPVLVAHPGRRMPTATAFARLSEMRGGRHPAAPAALGLDDLGSWEAVAALAENDLEQPAFEAIPVLTDAIAALADHGASIALLAGSGASIFGIFDSTDPIDEAARALSAQGMKTWQTSTLTRWPDPAPRD